MPQVGFHRVYHLSKNDITIEVYSAKLLTHITEMNDLSQLRPT